MSVKFRTSVKWSPNLGDTEKPYQLYLFIGGIPGFVQSRKICFVPGHEHQPLVEFSIPVPKNVARGDAFLPHDLALMVEAHCAAISPDELHQPGVMAAGTALVPLRECLQSHQGGAKYSTKLIYQNMIDSNPGYDGYKGDIEFTFDQPDFPAGMNPFLPPDELTVDHFKEEQNPVVNATIEASVEYCLSSPCRFNAPVVLPPFRFHKFLLPGQILGAKKCFAPIAESWWLKLVESGIRRAHPELPLELAQSHLESLGCERDHIEIYANALTAPANYWVYFPDETEVKGGGMLTGEAFCLSSRAKCGVHGKLYGPGQDCEDCAKDIESLSRSFDKSVQIFKNPFLAKLQDYASQWVLLQSLCGVNGQQLSDGRAAIGDPYANMGYHECAVLMHKRTFVKMVGKVNKIRPLFEGWANQYDPDAPIGQEDQPMVLEGTGLIDPRGNGYRNQLLPAYRYLFMGNKSNHFVGWKLIQWQNPKELSDFYRVFLQFVVPELYDKGYANASFVAMSKTSQTEWKRGFTYQELMNPHDGLGIRVEAGFTLEQSKMLQKVASFYPPIEPYVEPEPNPLRDSLCSKMNRIVETMKSCKRSIREGQQTLVADFFPAYHQIDDVRVDSICAMIRAKERIVDVTVQEEAIHEGLGGFAVAFHVDITPPEKERLNTLAGQRKLRHLPMMKLEAHIDHLLK